MNNKGQVIFLTFMIALTLIVLALGLAFPVKESIDIARNSNNLNCTNSTISTFDKGACIVADLTIFHYIGGLIFIAGMIVAAKVII